MQTSEWTRPPGLTALYQQYAELGPATLQWSDVVARAVAADTLLQVHEELETDLPASEVGTDFAGIWAGLGAGTQDIAEAAADVTADLVAHFEHLTQDQLEGLTDSVEDTAQQIRTQELVRAGELAEVPTAEQAAVDMVTDAARKLVPVNLVPVNLVGDVLNLGLGPRGLTSQAASIAGSLSPVPVPVPGLGGMAPELAVVSLAASAGMRIKNGEPVADVKQWLVGELSGIGVANAASVAVQLLSGLVVLRPLAVLGAKWTRARAETSTQATVAIRAAREKLAPLVRDA
jgi:hypothetical protein